MKPNRLLPLKLRYVLEPDRWDKRGAAERLQAKLTGRRNRAAKGTLPDYAPGRALYETYRSEGLTKTAALRAAYGEQPALFGVDMALEDNDLDRALLKWFDRSEEAELRVVYGDSDGRWLSALRSLLRG